MEGQRKDHSCVLGGQAWVRPVTEPVVLSAYKLGGLTAVYNLGIETSYYGVEDAKVLQAWDCLWLTGMLPKEFRLDDGSADGYARTVVGWERVIFPPLAWPKIDVDALVADIDASLKM